jgi:menaquinone-dependent protoporphyrinogen IX oxidase
MRVAIVFDTHTGITAAAAEKMAEVVRAAGHECTTASTWSADPAAVARADAIVIGAWTKGWFIVRQHPSEGTLTFLEKASLNGKPVAVFATYKLAAGSTITQLANAVERAGGRVTGMYKVKGPKVPAGFEGWVASLAA